MGQIYVSVPVMGEHTGSPQPYPPAGGGRREEKEMKGGGT
jgi:hypothetical protein